MMKRSFLFSVLFLLASCVSTADASDKSDVSWGHAYYFAFGIQRITGIPEHQIEEYGCLYKIRRDAFEQALISKIEAGREYNKFDVRAKVIFGSEVFFVDYDKIVIGPNKKIYGLDTKIFEQALVLEKCDYKKRQHNTN